MGHAIADEKNPPMPSEGQDPTDLPVYGENSASEHAHVPPWALESLRAAMAQHPQRVGPYRILDVLGEGGFGVVYRAERSEPIRQVVALKMILLGMDSREVVARFETEREALAMMDHPNIARVLD